MITRTDERKSWIEKAVFAVDGRPVARAVAARSPETGRLGPAMVTSIGMLKAQPGSAEAIALATLRAVEAAAELDARNGHV